MWCSCSGSPHRLRVPDVQAPGAEAQQGARAADREGRGGHRAGVPHGRAARAPARHELRAHEPVHRVRGRQAACRLDWRKGW